MLYMTQHITTGSDTVLNWSPDNGFINNSRIASFYEQKKIATKYKKNFALSTAKLTAIMMTVIILRSYII